MAHEYRAEGAPVHSTDNLVDAAQMAETLGEKTGHITTVEPEGEGWVVRDKNA